MKNQIFVACIFFAFATCVIAAEQRISLSRFYGLDGYYISLDIPSGYTWVEEYQAASYDCVGPSVIYRKVALDGKILETGELKDPKGAVIHHTLSMGMNCWAEANVGDMSVFLRNKTLSSEDQDLIYEEGSTEMNGYETYYAFSRKKEPIFETNRLSIAIALETRPFGVPWEPQNETPIIRLIFHALDTVEMRMGDEVMYYYVDGQRCHERTRQNLRHIIENIHVLKPAVWIDPIDGERVARVRGDSHSYWLRKASSDQWIKIGGGEAYLSYGDGIRTGKEPVEVKIKDERDLDETHLDDNIIIIGKNTTFIFEEHNRLELVWGKIRGVIRKLKPKDKFDVKIPPGGDAMTVRGTDFIVEGEEEQATVLVLEGVVDVPDIEGWVTVRAGEMIAVTDEGPREPERFDTTMLVERYASLFTSPEELDTIVEKIPEGLLLTALLVIAILVNSSCAPLGYVERPHK